jgi:hypothetical protein
MLVDSAQSPMNFPDEIAPPCGIGHRGRNL